ncbi:MAG TPA: lytic transglycosylase domain-containing protein, partial [Pseudobdellovibrionaceae bacterium]|nr:lytic transglycosylase domain-containing protein [Pseudobdellovibrionaceae bacterium]
MILAGKPSGTRLALLAAMHSKRKALLKMTGLTCLSLATAFAAMSSEDLKRSLDSLRPRESHPASVVNQDGSSEEGLIASLDPSRLIEETLTPPPLKSFENEPVTFDREAILSDHDTRISELFHIPQGLHDRVGFWFDIYTKHDSNRRVIHHAIYPWIVFKIIDVSSIINSDQPSRRWMRNEKADKYVKAQTEEIRAALRRLSKRGRAPRTDLEKELVQALLPLGGNLAVQARRASKEVRVQTGQKEHFTEGLRVSQRYLRPMERILESHRLPTELSRIPFVESSFNKHATSKVGASGIWQFMGNTGRKFMRVDSLIDERRSPFKATEGAARLLKENHMILNRSWPLAITAWNHGPPGVRRAIRATGSKDLSVIVSK